MSKTNSSKLKSHPHADLFPMMTDDELQSLADDIKENGLRQPVVLYQGQVLDGRNRLKACELAEVEPTFAEYEGDESGILAFVLSLNVQRRDLTAGQKAITAARVWGLDEKKSGRPRNDTDCIINQRSLVKQFRLSAASLTQARDLLKEAPDLAEQVTTGAFLADAYRQYEERMKEKNQQKRRMERLGHYRAAVEAGEMTAGEAEAAIKSEEEQAEYDASARQLFFRSLQNTLDWIEEWVSKIPDERLAWYTQEDALGTEHEMTVDDISEAIQQLERIKSITLKESSNGQSASHSSGTRSGKRSRK